jgi:hypothetical protein
MAIRRAIPATLLFLVCLAAFLISPRSQIRDSRYALLVSEQILAHGTITLDAFAPPPFGTPDARPVRAELPYQFLPAGAHVYYRYPLGTSILALPFVGLARAASFGVVDASGAYDREAEKELQHLLACLLMAGLVVVFHATARQLLSPGWSVGVALVAGFGTQIWSTTSRALWSHSFEILLIGIALWLVVRFEVRERPLRPLWLGTLLALAFFVRPTAAVSALAVTGYVAMRSPRDLVPLVSTGAAWLGLFLAGSFSTYASALPPYYQVSQHGIGSLGPGLAGLLVSPGRGLLVYVPVVGFVACLVAREWRQLRYRALAAAALAATLGQLVGLGLFPVWWGGHCYGPRLLSGLLPWLLVLAVLALEASGRRPRGGRDRVLSRPAGVAAGLLVAVSVYMNGVGAISSESMGWNTSPVDVDHAAGRLWDWRDPPFLRWRKHVFSED